METTGIASLVTDKCYQVPPRTDPNYLNHVMYICQKEAIHVYYALGEEEAIAASERRAEFDAIGTSVITPATPDMLAIATNKCHWHDFLAKTNISHAHYRNITSFDLIEQSVCSLGYPEEDVFVKPAVSKGGRGARIITAKDLSGEYYHDRATEPKISLCSYIDMLSPTQSSGQFLPILAMEYLPGIYYSVDVLSSNGKPYYTIPKIRIQGTASNTTVGEVSLDPAAIQLANDICRSFSFSYLQNYEMKVAKDGRIVAYDINPRGGASLALCAQAGANIAYYAVKMALGEEVPQTQVKNGVTMIRYYSEHYQDHT